MNCRRTFSCLFFFALSCGTGLSAAEVAYQSTVGMPLQIDQMVLPGPPLEVRPTTEETPLVLRIVSRYPHGTDHRYDFHLYGLEAGEYDLRDYLQLESGSPASDLPPIPIEISAVLPEGRVPPRELPDGTPRYLGGYQATLVVLGLCWLAGLVAIVWWIVRAARSPAGAQAVAHVDNLGDRLRPVVDAAIAGRATQRELAELERNLLSLWRMRLGLDDVTAVEAMSVLREHGEAGALLQQLEVWLHRPAATSEVDVARLLEPYQSLPADAFERAAGAQG